MHTTGWALTVYRGGQAVVDLISNKVQLYFAPMAEVVGHVQAAQVRLWNGIFGPVGMLPAAAARLSQELATVLR